MKDERAFRMLVECIGIARNGAGWTLYQTVDQNARNDILGYVEELDELLVWLKEKWIVLSNLQESESNREN